MLQLYNSVVDCVSKNQPLLDIKQGVSGSPATTKPKTKFQVSLLERELSNTYTPLSQRTQVPKRAFDDFVIGAIEVQHKEDRGEEWAREFLAKLAPQQILEVLKRAKEEMPAPQVK